LGGSLAVCAQVVAILENNRTYLNQNPKCEPRLGKRDLYSSVGGQRFGNFNEMALLWVLNLSDGSQDLLSIAERSEIAFETIAAAAAVLDKVGLLRLAEPSDPVSQQTHRPAGLCPGEPMPKGTVSLAGGLDRTPDSVGREIGRIDPAC
jgi:hypothetical protein